MNSKDVNTFSDLEIVEKFRQTKDLSWVGIVFQRYSKFVFLIAMKYIKDVDYAKDIEMQVFEKMMNDLHNHQILNFKAWIYTVTKNQALLFLRKAKSQDEKNSKLKKDLKIDMENPIFDHPILENEIVSKEIVVRNALNELNEDQKYCIELFYFEEKSYKEIEEITGLTPMKVKSYIQNGKRNLKILLEKQKGLVLLFIFQC